MPALGRTFDYLVPARWDGEVRTGTRVRIALHGRRVGGWVVADRSVPPPGVDLRPLAGLSGWGPPAGVIDLARWAAWRWAGPVAAFLRTASPDRNVASVPVPPPFVAPIAPGPGGPARAGEAELRSAAEEAFARVDVPTMLRVPPATDLLPLVEEVVRRGAPTPSPGGAPTPSPGGAPTPSPGGAPTPSPGGAVLVLVPNLGWADRLATRLARRGVPVASGWDEAAAGWPVVIGSRAAAWSPVPRLRAVVVLDAHDEAYREERAPTSTAWEILVERARREAVPCLLVSPCPSVVQLHRTRLRTVSRPLERGGWPRFVVVDRRGADPRTGLLSEELVAAAQRQVAAGGRVVCVLNRTGRARLLACASCGELARCEHCARSVEQVEQILRCRGCGEERPQVCASCGSTRLRVLRPGVARLREELEALLRVPVREVSGPGVPARSAPGEGEDAGDPGGSAVLVGTEAVLHRVRQASLVAFLDFDQHLLAPRFTAGEESLTLLARAGRLVGGRSDDDRGTPSAVLVQTRLPDHEVLGAAVRGDPGLLARPELALRRELSLPPVGAMALASGTGAGEFAAQAAAGGGTEAADLGDGRWLLRSATTRELCDALARVPRPRGRLRVEVDPTTV